MDKGSALSSLWIGGNESGKESGHGKEKEKKSE